MSQYTYIGPIKQMVTMAGLPLKGALKDEQLTVIENAGILINGDIIEAIGKHDDVIKEANIVHANLLSIEEDVIAMPGFVDAHTHICFAGSRAKDYAMRNAGISYLDIAKQGGGIWDTVQNTRAASLEDLTNNILDHAEEHLKRGTTTLEVKSGYGLTVDDELKMLEAIAVANKEISIDLIPTCLAAHIKPKDFEGDVTAYLHKMVEELFPVIKEKQLCNRVDAFIEATAFTTKDVQEYFKKAKENGWDITIHADQFTTSGSHAAVQINAVSADHLEASTDVEIKLLAASDTVAVALPGASMGLGCAYAPVRKLLDAGTCVAIASDHNPGSAPMGNLVMQAAVLGAYEKLTNAEVLAAITFRAAHALRLADRGSLEKGKLADLVLYKTDSYQNILYHQGMMLPSMVVKNGKAVHHQKIVIKNLFV